MLGILEICHRAQTGPRMDQQSFDLDMVFAAAQRLCEKYAVVYDPDTPVPSDDALADRVYQAAIDFVVEVGVFCPDTSRMIRFSRGEVLEAVACLPSVGHQDVPANGRGHRVMGEGPDRHVWMPRRPDSDAQPWYHVGTGIVNTDEQIAFDLVRSYAAIGSANSISAPALDKIGGYPVVSGTPSEILGSIRGIRIAREALQQAGRPGLAIGNCRSTAGTALATMAASAPQFGLRPSDGWLVGALAEMKYNMAAMNKAAYLADWGANIGAESGPMVGGYAGGPANVVILDVAYRIVGRLLLGCQYHVTSPIQVDQQCSTTRDTIWCAALSAQAISRNTDELVWSLAYIAAGPMTKQFFYESAAYLAALISSGVSAQTCHPARAPLSDHVTPMEIRGTVEIMQACVGMTRAEANQVVKDAQGVVVILILVSGQIAVDTCPSHLQVRVRQGIAGAGINQDGGELFGQAQGLVELPNRQQSGVGAQGCLDGLDNDRHLCEKVKSLLPNTLRFHLGPPCGVLSDPPSTT